MKPIPWRNLLEACSDFRRTWPQLVVADLLARIATVVVLTPIVGLLIKLFLLTADDGVLADTDIVLFLLHPFGMLALVIVSAVWLGILFAELGVLMAIGYGAVEIRRITWLEAIRYVAGYAVELVHLAARVIVRLLLMCTPFVAGIYAVYRLWLGGHDINFYLADKPPALWWAMVLAGLLAIGMTVLVLKKVAGWMIALPLVLFEGVGAGRSLRESRRKSAASAWNIVILLVAWFVGIALLSVIFTFVVGLIGKILVPVLGGHLVLTAAGLGGTLLLAGLGNLAIAIVSTAFFPLLVVRLYRSLAGPGRFEPEPGERRPLGETPQLLIPGKAILALGIAAFFLFLLGGYAFTRNVQAEEAIQIIAHRGASAAAPENTMAAFRRAIDEQADWIELDVQENCDGTVVVAHDSDFMKVARNPLKVWNATDEALRGIDIGSWYAPEYADQRVPTLREALKLAGGRLGVVIELKYYGHDRSLESRVVEIVEQTGMEAQVMIMSLKLAGIQKFAALRPQWPLGLLNTASIGDLTRLDLDFLGLNARAASLSTIRRAQKRGMRVYVWTVNHPVQMSVMMSRGVDGIITDEPALARQVLALRQQLSPLGRLVVWIAGETGLLHGVDAVSADADA